MTKMKIPILNKCAIYGDSTRGDRVPVHIRRARGDRDDDWNIFNYRDRMRQRTIRMMVEKGQPVPAELLAPATRGIRRRSDARRGVVWTMVGLGLMIWLAAVNDWEGGAWSFGLIPFLIGLGYLIVWKLENKKDIPPPPPAP
jgi:hypothetical protein